MKKKHIRITTVPISLHKLLKGQLKFMSEFYDVVLLINDAGTGCKTRVRIKE